MTLFDPLSDAGDDEDWYEDRYEEWQFDLTRDAGDDEEWQFDVPPDAGDDDYWYEEGQRLDRQVEQYNDFIDNPPSLPDFEFLPSPPPEGGTTGIRNPLNLMGCQKCPSRIRPYVK